MWSTGWTGKIIIIFPTMVDLRGKMTPALRVRIPPPKQAATAPTAAAPVPKPGRSSAATKQLPQQQRHLLAVTTAPAAGLQHHAPAAAPVDPELEDDPVKPLHDEIEDEIPF